MYVYLLIILFILDSKAGELIFDRINIVRLTYILVNFCIETLYTPTTFTLNCKS